MRKKIIISFDLIELKTFKIDKRRSEIDQMSNREHQAQVYHRGIEK